MRRKEFHALYERYAGEVYRFAFWLSGSATDAEDLTAETFARAWVMRDRICVETVKAYLLTITRNTYLKWRRRSALRLEIPGRAAVSRSGEDDLLHQETLNLVWLELRRMKVGARSAFLLRVLHELPYREIARILGVSVASAKVTVHRVRLRLALASERGEKR